MTIGGIRTAIQTALATITGLHAYAEYPDIIQLPAGIVSLRFTEPVSFDLTAGNGSVAYHFIIDLLLLRGGSIAEAQDKLDPYLALSGTQSIKVAVEAATLTTHADVIRVINVISFGPIDYNGTLYLGARFSVDVWV